MIMVMIMVGGSSVYPDYLPGEDLSWWIMLVLIDGCQWLWLIVMFDNDCGTNDYGRYLW